MPNGISSGRIAAGSARPQRSSRLQPLVSVVVPVFQVQDYLAECLDSLLAQAYARLEIVLVDDGSTDRSPQIAAEYAARDQRITLVRQPNAGLGAARNAGLDRCTGDLVTFVDSDDTVPADAYQRMVRTLRRTGSDFVVGAYVRNDGGVDKMRSWVRQAHARRRLQVTIDDVPDLLSNVVACTKLFRRDFLERIGFRFPEAVRYEDQVPVTRAYLEARAFDVIPAVVYRWRTRADRSSITQRKHEISDLLDRVTVMGELAQLIREHASVRVQRRWYVKVFKSDLYAYLKVAADADDDYWQLFQENLVATALAAPAGVEDDMELRVRVAVWLARHDQRVALRRLIRQPGFARSDFPVHVHDGHLVADLAFLRTDVPESLRRIRTVDIALNPRLEAIDWSRTGRLGLRLVAPMRYVDPGLHEVVTTFALVGPEDARLEVSTQVVPDPDANLAARRSFEDHTRSSVAGEIDLAALVRASAHRASTRWELRVATEARGLAAEARVATRREDGSPVAVRYVVVDGALVTTAWSAATGLVVEVRSSYAAVTRVRTVGDGFEIDLRAPGAAPVSGVLAGRARLTAALVSQEDDRQTLRCSPADAGDAPLSGRVRVLGAFERPTDLPVLDGAAGGVLPGPGVLLEAGSVGVLTAVPDQPTLVVDEVSIEDRTAVVRGLCHGLTSARARLRGPRAATAWTVLTVCDTAFEVRLDLEADTVEGSWAALPHNHYIVDVRAGEGRVRVRAGELFSAPEAPAPRQGWSVTVDAERRVLLRRSAHAVPAEGSSFVQQGLRSGRYRSAVDGPRRDAVVFECFSGTGTGDGPRAVSDRLVERGGDLDLVWSVEDRSLLAPPGTRAVLRGSPEWYDALGSAAVLVSNDALPEFFVKGREQVYVQTWHGTPLKRIGRDIVAPRLTTEHHVRMMLREMPSWDLLVSPNPFCTEVFRRALGYQGEILEIGRPSNDLLVRDDAHARGREVRRRLGVPEEHTVVLYAPTYRDDARRRGSGTRVRFLDHSLLTAARPDVTVLVRNHSHSFMRARLMDHERVVDVTSYPDIAHLYLAADVLVTDYSAALFDFALTDRPVIVLAPDLESYRDQVRGLYMDLEAMAPGPVVRSTEDVLAALDEDLGADARKRLRESFSPHDDGGVTDRLLERVLPQSRWTPG